MPILTAIHNRSIDIGCRPSSSHTIVTLFRVDSNTGKHIELPYEHKENVLKELPIMIDDKDTLRRTISMATYNSRTGFRLFAAINDRFICRAQFFVAERGWPTKSADHNIIIQYTSIVSIYLMT